MLVPLPDEPLRGAIVALRPWEPDDADWYVCARDEEIFRWTTEPRDLRTDTLRGVIEAYRRRPTHAGFAITDITTSDLLGNISLVFGDPNERTAEVSYWLAREARGRGAAADAVRALTRWAFDVLLLERIELRTNVGNAASQRVAARTGFRPAGERDGQLVFVLDESS
jgi:ribosomal-protein-alanine N-acetyltransferase